MTERRTAKRRERWEGAAVRTKRAGMARRRTRTPRHLAGRAAVVLVLAAGGLLFATSAQTSAGTDLRSETADLGALVAERSRTNEVRAGEVAVLRAQVDTLSRTGTDAAGPAADDPLVDTALGTAAGAIAVDGPGVVVTLDDAPRGVDRPVGAVADDLVVHQQDVEAVVNALWAGGAEAMMIMDQRIVSTSAVRCVGNVLVLQGRTYSPPYTISAIGDPAALRDSLEASSAIAIYQQYVAASGLGYGVDVRAGDGELRLPAFDGTVRMEHALPSAATTQEGS